MWWRAPWLTQRWTLLGLAIFDSCAVIAVYNILFHHRFGYWAGISGSPAVISTLWVVSSYLFGRYSLNLQDKRKAPTFDFLSTAAIGTSCALLIAVTSWLLNSEDPRAFRSFVVPATVYGTALSYLGQRFKHRLERKAGENWVIMGSREEIEVIRKEQQTLPVTQRNGTALQVINDIVEVEDLPETENRHLSLSETISISSRALQVLLLRREKGLKIQSMVSWCENNLQRVPPELLSDRWLVVAEGFSLRPGSWGWRVKRLADISIATILLITTAPVVGIAALAVLVTDKGPVFYSQIRTGLNGDPFRIWKLRTMKPQAEHQGAQWASRNDPRITTIGAWLRKTRIDELPQLISVIKGEMSLIGPRPERPEMDATLELEIPHYRIRHWIRPGLSGWAQVCYPYGASIEDSRQKLSYDIFYVRNASLGLDFLILMKTIRLVLFARGATPITDSQKIA
jgi:exopolysaccharide biosynthesis polyprenyl glycosylphosphotransferase